MLAALTGVKELILSEEEAKSLSDAARAVAKEYQYFLTDKQIAWFNLTCVCGNIYGTRMMAWGLRRGAEKRPKVSAPPASAPAGAAPPVNGHAADARETLNLTPNFLTAPPVGEEVP